MAAKIVRCNTAFGFEDNGMTRVIPAGNLVSTEDVAFKQFKEYFDDVETHVDQQKKLAARAANREDESQPVEQATAAPGEKRTTVRPVSTPAVADKPAAATSPVKSAVRPNATVKADDSKSS